MDEPETVKGANVNCQNTVTEKDAEHVGSPNPREW